MVAGGTDQRVAVVHPAAQDGVEQGPGAAGRQEGDLVPAVTERAQAIAGIPALRQQALGLDAGKVLGCVDPEDGLLGDRLDRQPH